MVFPWQIYILILNGYALVNSHFAMDARPWSSMIVSIANCQSPEGTRGGIKVSSYSIKSHDCGWLNPFFWLIPIVCWLEPIQSPFFLVKSLRSLLKSPFFLVKSAAPPPQSLKEWRYASRAWTTSIRPWRRAKPASCDMADGWTCGGAQAGDVYRKPMVFRGKPWKTYAFLYVLFAFIFADESDGFCWFRSELPSSKWPEMCSSFDHFPWLYPLAFFESPFSCPCLTGAEK